MRPNHIWHRIYPTCRTWNLQEILRGFAEWQPGGLYMVAGGLLACQLLHICFTDLSILSASSLQRLERVKRHFAQVQHKSPCRHLFFALITAQPVLLSITFGLHLHFDSSLSVLSCSLNPCQLFSLAELSRFAKLWHVFTDVKATSFCQQCSAPWTETSDVKNVGELWPRTGDHHEAVITSGNNIRLSFCSGEYLVYYQFDLFGL